jgi:hypothetical protein
MLLIISNALSAELKWKIDMSKGEQKAGSWVKTRRGAIRLVIISKLGIISSR